MKQVILLAVCVAGFWMNKGEAAPAAARPAPPAPLAPPPPPPPSPLSSSSFDKGSTATRQFLFAAGIDDGGLILGGIFDFIDTANENYGVYTRLYSKDTNKGAPGLFALGGHFRGHAKIGILDYYIAPGFGLLQHSLRKTELLFGPTLSIGLSADLDKTIALGIENAKLYSWVGEYKGIIKDSFLATIRFNLP